MIVRGSSAEVTTVRSDQRGLPLLHVVGAVGARLVVSVAARDHPRPRGDAAGVDDALAGLGDPECLLHRREGSRLVAMVLLVEPAVGSPGEELLGRGGSRR